MFTKKGRSGFSHKKGGVGKIGGSFKKAAITYFHIYVIFLNVWWVRACVHACVHACMCVCVCARVRAHVCVCVCVYFTYLHHFHIVCVSQKELTVIKSNQQIYDFSE